MLRLNIQIRDLLVNKSSVFSRVKKNKLSVHCNVFANLV